MAVMKPMINIAEKTPISPLTSEQLILFEKDNLVVNVDKSSKILILIHRIHYKYLKILL